MDVDLIDLIQMRSEQLRKIADRRWNERDYIYLSDSEWFILSQAYKEGKTAIADITKRMDISRQATHKFIRNLADKGLVKIDQLENNKKAKSIELTDQGMKCYEKKKSLKIELEKEIVNNVGGEQINKLKEILQAGWGL